MFLLSAVASFVLPGNAAGTLASPACAVQNDAANIAALRSQTHHRHQRPGFLCVRLVPSGRNHSRSSKPAALHPAVYYPRSFLPAVSPRFHGIKKAPLFGRSFSDLHFTTCCHGGKLYNRQKVANSMPSGRPLYARIFTFSEARYYGHYRQLTPVKCLPL